MSRFFITALVLIVIFLTSAVTTNAADQNYLTIKDLRVLIVIYRGPEDAEPRERIDNEELRLIRGAIECGRMFYFRNTFGKLNLTVSYEIIDTAAPANVTPDGRGPTYDNIINDLRERGYVNNQFDGIYTTGIGMAGNWGGFRVFDKTGAAFGGGSGAGALRQFPSADKSIGYDWAWTFVHEFQHALDLAIAGGAGFHEFVHGHPYVDETEHPDRPIIDPGAQHWDWEACTLRNFKQYIEIPGATSSYIYALDTDGDGLADYHPSLPMDEKRFGTNPNDKDTDDDGLTDLDEFCADIYFGSNPLDNDSDCDGIPDDQDKWPTVAISKTMEYAYPTPVIDGKIDGVYSSLITRWYATNWDDLEKEAIQTYACWDEKNLYFVVKAPAKFSLDVQIDTSAHNGFWEGGDTYIWNVKTGGLPAIQVPKKREWPGAKAVWRSDDEGNTIVEMVLPVMIGQGWSREANFGGSRLPEDIADGMVLLNGRGVSFNIAVDFPEMKKRALLTPTWTMISTKLMKDPRDPDMPILRFSERMQNTKTPVVRVDGVSAKTKITIVDDKGKVLGKSRGSGAIDLKGVKTGSDPESGKNIIFAKTSTGKISPPFELIIDASAKPPVLTKSAVEDGVAKLGISGEPAARVIVEYEAEPGKWVPVAMVVLDEKGEAVVDFDLAFEGFYAEYYNTEIWTEPAMYRIDPVINFDYKDGTPMKGIIGSESFSMRWTGYMDLEKETKATFFLSTDDGSRLYIDDKVIVDHWGHHGKSEKSGDITLSPGIHLLRVDYYEETGWAAAQLEWQPEGGERTYDIPVKAFERVPAKKIFRAVQVDVLENKSEPSKTLIIR